MEYKHVPVMLDKVMEYLKPEAGGYFIDCTLGGGGYTIEIAKKVRASGKVLAIDLDEMAIKNLELRIKNLESASNIILVKDNFNNLLKIVDKNFENKNIKFDGIVFDLGLSSAQLADRKKGFSFQFDAPLDMAFDRHRLNTDLGQIYPVKSPAGKRSLFHGVNTDTQIIINKWPQEELKRILRDYGEEKFAGRIARKIVEERKAKPIKTTGQLVKIIERAVSANYRHGRIHFATKIFQALRIATNKELENLKEALPQAVELLRSGGRLVVLSYHSLEDRIVKFFLKQESKNCLCPPQFPICQCEHKAKVKILTTKPVKPTADEIRANLRARSAKLRTGVKI